MNEADALLGQVIHLYTLSIQTVLIVLIIALLTVIICLVIFIISSIKKRNQQFRMQYVRETSHRLCLLFKLNDRYSPIFNDCSSTFKKECCLNSKQQFDTFNYTKIFNQSIDSHLEAFEDIVSQVNINIEIYDHYLNEQLAIYDETLVPQTLPRVFKDPQQYLQIEYQMLESYALRPVTNVTFELYWFYTSPQGRNHYRNQHVFDLPDIEAAINTAYELAEKRESK